MSMEHLPTYHSHRTKLPVMAYALISKTASLKCLISITDWKGSNSIMHWWIQTNKITFKCLLSNSSLAKIQQCSRLSWVPGRPPLHLVNLIKRLLYHLLRSLINSQLTILWQLRLRRTNAISKLVVRVVILIKLDQLPLLPSIFLKIKLKVKNQWLNNNNTFQIKCTYMVVSIRESYSRQQYRGTTSKWLFDPINSSTSQHSNSSRQPTSSSWPKIEDSYRHIINRWTDICARCMRRAKPKEKRSNT